MPAAFPECYVAVTLQSCYLVYFRVQTLCIPGMAQCCNGTYSGFVQNHLKQYIPPCNACPYPEDFNILIWYSVHLDLHSLLLCADPDKRLCRSRCTEYQIKMLKSSELQHALQGGMYHYRAVQGGFILYLSMYYCITVPTEYVLVCTCNSKTFTSMYQYVLGTSWYVLGKTKK
jgi:hypothetical protein